MQLQLLLLALISVKYLNATCDGIYESGVSKEEQDEIVNVHNNFRLMIAHGEVPGQPKGINLKRMKWDDELAKAGQEIANTCEFQHVSVSDDRWPWVGQNLFTWMATYYTNGTDWTSGVTAWFDEHVDYTYGTEYIPGTGHYTQVIWANSDHVGCGYTHFPTTGKYSYQKLYVCNYGPGGNYVGQYPYETGTSGCENLC